MYAMFDRNAVNGIYDINMETCNVLSTAHNPLLAYYHLFVVPLLYSW